MAEVSGETLDLLLAMLEEEEVLDEIYKEEIKEINKEVSFLIFSLQT